LTLSSSTGIISGTPTTAGSYAFIAQVADSQSPSDTQTKQLSIVVNPAQVVPPNITTTSLPNGQRGVAYNQTLQATGGVTPYTWSLASGSLPIGVSLNGATGVISGTPTKKGTFSFVVRVRDSQAVPGQDTQSLSIRIAR
jgi:hypothetical protein